MSSSCQEPEPEHSLGERSASETSKSYSLKDKMTTHMHTHHSRAQCQSNLLRWGGEGDDENAWINILQ
jgi:hypothetical protein